MTSQQIPMSDLKLADNTPLPHDEHGMKEILALVRAEFTKDLACGDYAKWWPNLDKGHYLIMTLVGTDDKASSRRMFLYVGSSEPTLTVSHGRGVGSFQHGWTPFTTAGELRKALCATVTSYREHNAKTEAEAKQWEKEWLAQHEADRKKRQEEWDAEFGHLFGQRKKTLGEPQEAASGQVPGAMIGDHH
jgi:hypothetical protein